MLLSKLPIKFDTIWFLFEWINYLVRKSGNLSTRRMECNYRVYHSIYFYAALCTLSLSYSFCVLFTSYQIKRKRRRKKTNNKLLMFLNRLEDLQFFFIKQRIFRCLSLFGLNCCIEIKYFQSDIYLSKQFSTPNSMFLTNKWTQIRIWWQLNCNYEILLLPLLPFSLSNHIMCINYHLQRWQEFTFHKTIETPMTAARFGHV